MSQSSGSNLKLLYLLRMFEEKTDEENGISMREILSWLESRGISAERKSIYDNIEALVRVGYDITSYRKNRTTYYKLNSRLFEPPELKLMVDTIATSKLITAEQSQNLIKKIEKLGSNRQASALQRNVYVYDRPKTKNENVFNNIEILTEAINNHKIINFEYYRWSKDKKLVLRQNGIKENISPQGLEFYDGNYYLIAIDNSVEKIRHYRVDKIGKIVLSGDDKKRTEKKIEFPKYSAQMLSMFAGPTRELRFEVDEENVGILIDRFGAAAVKILPIPTAAGKYICRVELQVSNQLLGWILSVSDKVDFIGPEDVREQYQSLLRQTLSNMSSNR